MTIENIKRAQAEAKRFLTCADAVVREAMFFPEKPNVKFVSTGKHSGALRRASMDLTRALAEMRKA